MALPRVYADFQNLDDDNRLRLTCVGTRRDLEREGIELREGLHLTFYTDDANDHGEPDELVVDGTVQYNDADQCWVAAIDWDALRHVSESANGTNDGNAADARNPAEQADAIREALADRANGNQGIPFEEIRPRIPKTA